MAAADNEQALVELGLTGLEAQIYAFLLQESPVTGYRIAQAVGKPAANVYKALQSLEQKGAVEVDLGKTSLYRPVPVEQLLDALERRFKRHIGRAADSLKQLPGPADDTRIYQLRDREQVYAKCRQMLQSAKKVVLLDLFLKPLMDLGPDIEKAAAKKGLDIVLKVYSPVQVKGIKVILEPDHERVRDRWPAQWINMNVDGSEMLLALLDNDGDQVIQAVWSGSPFLSWIHHGGLGNEFVMTVLREKSPDLPLGGRGELLSDLYDRFISLEAPGYHRLLRQIGAQTSAGED
jgi:sugar-specific transcriptional regulator TrmB